MVAIPPLGSSGGQLHVDVTRGLWVPMRSADVNVQKLSRRLTLGASSSCNDQEDADGLHWRRGSEPLRDPGAFELHRDQATLDERLLVVAFVRVHQLYAHGRLAGLLDALGHWAVLVDFALFDELHLDSSRLFDQVNW